MKVEYGKMGCKTVTKTSFKIIKIPGIDARAIISIFNTSLLMVNQTLFLFSCRFTTANFGTWNITIDQFINFLFVSGNFFFQTITLFKNMLLLWKLCSDVDSYCILRVNLWRLYSRKYHGFRTTDLCLHLTRDSALC